MADKEKLSALMDGELVDNALIQELEQDSASQQAWQNYHLIGDVMRGEVPDNPQWDIAESVALALEGEPTHRRLDSQQAQSAALFEQRLESQPQPKKARRELPKWLSQLGQVAVAACVSLVVIVGVQQYSGHNAGGVQTAQQSEQLPVLQTVPLAGSAEPVSLTRESVEKSMNRGNLQEQRRRIHAMLRDYELQLRLNSASSELDNSEQPLKSEVE